MKCSFPTAGVVLCDEPDIEGSAYTKYPEDLRDILVGRSSRARRTHCGLAVVENTLLMTV